MQITAKLLMLLPLQTGMGKNGEWRKQDIVVEVEGQYTRKVCISIWGDKINASVLVPGNTLSIDFDIESREFNGKWYTDVKAWRVTPASSEQAVSAPPPPIPPDAPIGNAPLGPDLLAGGTDDLPF